MSYQRLRLLVALPGALLALAACVSVSPSWTFAPTASPGPATPEPSIPSAAPTLPATPAPTTSQPTASPGTPGSPDASGTARTIALELTANLQIHQDGQQVTSLTVTEGETIHFEVTNSAGFSHNLYIGPPEQLATNQTAGLPGVPDFTEGTQSFDYTVTAETASLEYACTIPGHYQLMRGTFTVEP
jgi:hypothetical protein